MDALRRLTSAGLLLATLAVAGCQQPAAQGWIDPGIAVQLAAAAGPDRGVEGVFALRVRSMASQGGRFYLNSEPDYRDPRNLTVALDPEVVGELAPRLDAPTIQQALKDQRILVRGEARLVRIHFFSNGQPSGKYYWQVHVVVSDAGQILLPGEKA